VRREGAANDLSGIRGALGHELVYVVVVTVLDARIDAPGPQSPQAVAYTLLAEARQSRAFLTSQPR
jgi:hypothetical protein